MYPIAGHFHSLFGKSSSVDLHLYQSAWGLVKAQRRGGRPAQRCGGRAALGGAGLAESSGGPSGGGPRDSFMRTERISVRVRRV